MLSYPSGMTVSNRALIMLADLLRKRRATLGTRWRRLNAGRQALLVVAYLRKGETYADLAGGFAIGTTTVYRYVREALDLLAAQAPTLEQALEVARGKAYVIIDGTLLRIDRVGMTGGQDRPYHSGKHKTSFQKSVSVLCGAGLVADHGRRWRGDLVSSGWSAMSCGSWWRR